MESGGNRLPRGADVDVREFEGDVADAGAPVGDAELAGARGDILAILAAHVRHAHTNPHLCRPARSPLRSRCLAYFLLYLRRLTSARLRQPCHTHPLALSPSDCG